MPNAKAQANEMWTSNRAYTMAVICLLVGMRVAGLFVDHNRLIR